MIDNVVAGTHKVEIVAEGREPVSEEIDIAKDQRRFVDVKLRYALPRVVAAEKEQTLAQDAPASITVITADEIRGFGYTTLAEALQSVRGLYTTYDRDYATLGVRGCSSPGVYNSRVLVLSDGHITNESSLGQGYVKTDARNDRSRRAIERLGARLDGVLRSFQPGADGAPRDTAYYTVLQSEWPSVKGALEKKLG